MKYLLTLIIIVLTNWIAYSQTISIPEESKREIVITLESYPIVLKELDAANNIIDSQNTLIVDLKQQIENYIELNSIKDAQIINFNEQKQVYTKQIKKLNRKKNSTLIIGGAVLIGVLIIK